MKTLKYSLSIFLLSAAFCIQAQDPIYGSAENKKKPERKYVESSQEVYDSTYSDPEYYDPTAAGANTYINNMNVYGRGYDPFFRPSLGLGFYSPFGMGMYAGPYSRWGLSFGMGWGYGAFGYDPFWYDPFYSPWNYGFNSWYNPWYGYNPYFYRPYDYYGYGWNGGRVATQGLKRSSGLGHGINSRAGYTRPQRSGITARPGGERPSIYEGKNGVSENGNYRQPRRNGFDSGSSGGVSPKYRPSSTIGEGRTRPSGGSSPNTGGSRQPQFDRPSRPTPSSPAPSFRGGSGGAGGGGSIRGGVRGPR